MSSDPQRIQVGDWLKFRRGGLLVISQVEHIRPRASWDSTPVYETMIGTVEADSVLEIRSAAIERKS